MGVASSFVVSFLTISYHLPLHILTSPPLALLNQNDILLSISNWVWPGPTAGHVRQLRIRPNGLWCSTYDGRCRVCAFFFSLLSFLRGLLSSLLSSPSAFTSWIRTSSLRLFVLLQWSPSNGHVASCPGHGRMYPSPHLAVYAWVLNTFFFFNSISNQAWPDTRRPDTHKGDITAIT